MLCVTEKHRFGFSRCIRKQVEKICEYCEIFRIFSQELLKRIRVLDVLNIVTSSVYGKIPDNAIMSVQSGWPEHQ